MTSTMGGITSTGDIQESSAGPKMGSTSRDIGYSVGGAKDINNFRENIENDYLPLPTDITYEGLFYDYYFDTGQKESCSQLFCPSYSYATSIDPISNETDNYLSVGLNSGIKDFERKKLNLVIVLDISGSMGSSFKNYYYDGEKQESSDESKMTIATGAVADLLGHLKPDDRFGMVLFENNAHKAKPLRKVDRTDMTAIRNHILEISSTGGTNFEAGYKKGTELFNEHLTNNPEYENRIIFLTDAMPNRGVTGEEGLLGLTKSNANDKIHTSFIGMGVDFNTELIEQITKIRGANYYSVHSAEEFQKRMDDQFEYMVTPLVFNLTLNLDAQGYDIEKVYGSPEANEATGEIMKVNTLFPSEKKKGKTKGGIVLLKLDRQSPEASMKLSVDYETREGEKKHSEKSVTLEDKENFYDNSGIRKAILLSRYADLMKNWIIDERNNYENQEPVTPRVNKNDGIIVPKALGKWERQSVPLQVSEEYKEIFRGFTKYYKDEMDKLNDTTLSKELDIINTLIKSSKGTS
ncbi:MAG: vWA domain-containing protein [Candidatus Nanoarchaeia archaeon]